MTDTIDDNTAPQSIIKVKTITQKHDTKAAFEITKEQRSITKHIGFIDKLLSQRSANPRPMMG
jgi:hypothetical protein